MSHRCVALVCFWVILLGNVKAASFFLSSICSVWEDVKSEANKFYYFRVHDSKVINAEATAMRFLGAGSKDEALLDKGKDVYAYFRNTIG